MTGPENDRPSQPSDETMAFSSDDMSDTDEQPTTLYKPIPPDEPPMVWRQRQMLVVILVFIVGLMAGYAAARLLAKPDDSRIPSGNQVLYEEKTVTFPVRGAEFTKSAFNEDTKKCEKDVLLNDLPDNSKRYGAWLGLQHINTTEFKPFVSRLETKILLRATPATDFGCFPDGPCPFGIQAVLGPGTPAWFDPVQDRIVAKCTSSSPLRSPDCPPNCEIVPTPTPTPKPTPTPSPTPDRTSKPHRSSSPHHTSTPPTGTPAPIPSPSTEPTPTLPPVFTPEPCTDPTPPPGFTCPPGF